MSNQPTSTLSTQSGGEGLNISVMAGGLLGGIGALTILAFFIGYFQDLLPSFFSKQSSVSDNSIKRRRSRLQEDEEKVSAETQAPADEIPEKGADRDPNEPEKTQSQGSTFMSYINILLNLSKRHQKRSSETEKDESNMEVKQVEGSAMEQVAPDLSPSADTEEANAIGNTTHQECIPNHLVQENDDISSQREDEKVMHEGNDQRLDQLPE